MAVAHSVEDKVLALIEDIFRVEDSREFFTHYVTLTPEAIKLQRWTERWLEILNDSSSHAPSDGTAVPSSVIETAVKCFITTMASKRAANPKLQAFMSSMLETSVQNHTVPSRVVCDALLSSDLLKLDKPEFYVAAMTLIKKIVSGVDYKGVREIMKACMDKLVLMPDFCTVNNSGVGESVEQQLSALHSVTGLMLNRKKPLLPGYFVINEILKAYPDNPLWPHWTLAPLVSSFMNSFRPAAQIVTSVYKPKMKPVVEMTNKGHCISSWKIEPSSFRFLLKGSQTYDRILPFSRALTEPQKGLVTYIMRQMSSRELIQNIMGIQKPRSDALAQSLKYPLLEDQLVELFCYAMEETILNNDEQAVEMIWTNATSSLVYYLLIPLVDIRPFIFKLHEAIQKGGLKESRDELMFSLLNYISGFISRNANCQEVLPVVKLFALYDDPRPLPVPDMKRRDCVVKLAAASIYIQLSAFYNSSGDHVPFTLPLALRNHYRFLKQLNSIDINYDASLKEDYFLIIHCNAYSAIQDLGKVRVDETMKLISGISDDGSISETIPMAGSDCMAVNVTEPLPLSFIDRMTVHSKMVFMGSIANLFSDQMKIKTNILPSPALIETYCRLLSSPEVASPAIKSLLGTLLPSILKSNAWIYLHMILEMFSYRLTHISSQHRVSFLTRLQGGLLTGPHTTIIKHPQLNASMEFTTLRLLLGLGNAELLYSKGQGNSSAKPVQTFCGESEELNKVAVLCLARAIRVNGLEIQSGTWVKEVLTNIMAKTPHSWPTYTLKLFPPIIQDFYNENSGHRENRSLVSKLVEDEYRTFTSMSNEHDIVQHFTNPSSNVFLSVIYRMVNESDQISPVAFKVLERLGAKQMTLQVRTLCDLLICEFSKSGASGQVNKCVTALNALIWRYNIVSLDKLMLCLSLRCYEGNEPQVCLYVIQLILMKPLEFKTYVAELIRAMPPNHQELRDFYKCHMDYHTAKPENFWPKDFHSEQIQAFPTFFGNVCLRFLYVLDVVLPRFLEVPVITKALETLIEQASPLYKYHDRPITFLYNMLYYYDNLFREKQQLKEKFVGSIIIAVLDVHPPGWFVTQHFIEYLSRPVDSDVPWIPDEEYYFQLLDRFVRSIQNKNPFPHLDWHFNEFPNEGSHALYATCVELMGLPLQEPAKVCSELLDVVMINAATIGCDDLPDYVNAAGLIVSNLPDTFAEGLIEKLVNTIKMLPSNPALDHKNFFDLLDDESIGSIVGGATPDVRSMITLALAHATWHHAGYAQIQQLPDLVKERLEVLIHTEEQYLFMCRLVGPFIQRLHSDRNMRPMFELGVLLYKLLAQVDEKVTHFKYIDAICDILYHIKYQFIGDSIKTESERYIRMMKPRLQLRLRFISPDIFPPQPAPTRTRQEPEAFSFSNGSSRFVPETAAFNISLIR